MVEQFNPHVNDTLRAILLPVFITAPRLLDFSFSGVMPVSSSSAVSRYHLEAVFLTTAEYV
ncbi:MAG: hypothetical protein WAV32_03090 [Halobacteriota archaeon]